MALNFTTPNLNFPRDIHNILSINDCREPFLRGAIKEVIKESYNSMFT